MDIIYKQRAAAAIVKVASFIESRNTEGSGVRWFYDLDDKINSLARAKIELQFCRHKALVRHHYRCFYYKGWVVAYRTTANKLEVCRFIWGGRLP